MRKHIIRSVIAGLLAISSAVLLLCMTQLSDSLSDQTAAQRWQQGDMRYTQLSCFMRMDDALDESGIFTLRSAVQSEMESASLQAPSENARLWIDAYSGRTTVTAANGNNSISAVCIATGGDFFQFHPLQMMDGWYYEDDEVMDDGVILDQQLAWELFGGYALTGMTVYINGYPCKISGVCSMPDADWTSYGTEPVLYIPAEFLSRIGNPVTYTCYEVLLPDPIRDFGMGILEKHLTKKDCIIRENTGRYSLFANLQYLAALPEAGWRTAPVEFPWWENDAQTVAFFCAALELLAMVLLLYPLIALGILAGTGLRRLKKCSVVQKVLSFGREKN